MDGIQSAEVRRLEFARSSQDPVVDAEELEPTEGLADRFTPPSCAVFVAGVGSRCRW